MGELTIDLEIVKIKIGDEIYPEQLRKIKNPPKQLYLKGNIELLKQNCIAIIGSRSCTKNGENLAKKFASELSGQGLTIVSGLAIGIDSYAHMGALIASGKGKTIAVLGSGLNYIFPKENEGLYYDILKSGGLIISEYSPNVEPNSKMFLERNRIVSGISIGILVIEAMDRSGTSVTARYTKNLNKPVFCVPSSLENSKGLGTNELIKNGSKLVTKVEDILIEYPQIKFKKKLLKEREKQVPKELEKVYKCIKNEPANINQIVRKTKMSIQDISYKIMLLQLENLIEELPGQVYRIKNGEDDE